jgi:hypothetical protein
MNAQLIKMKTMTMNQLFIWNCNDNTSETETNVTMEEET